MKMAFSSASSAEGSTRSGTPSNLREPTTATRSAGLGSGIDIFHSTRPYVPDPCGGAGEAADLERSYYEPREVAR